MIVTAPDTTEVFLNPGDFHFGGGHTRISTLLGSCVSITLWHPRHRIGGMCHYMLAERRRSADTPLDGRFGTEAFAMFLERVAAAQTRPSEYEAKLFGGGNMLAAGGGEAMEIGPRNIELGRELLARHNISLVAEHVGGSGRRKLHFELWSGNVWLAFPEGSDATVRNPNG